MGLNKSMNGSMIAFMCVFVLGIESRTVYEQYVRATVVLKEIIPVAPITT